MGRWVGESERRVRSLFFEAEQEWKERGEASALHVVVIDEVHMRMLTSADVC